MNSEICDEIGRWRSLQTFCLSSILVALTFLSSSYLEIFCIRRCIFKNLGSHCLYRCFSSCMFQTIRIPTFSDFNKRIFSNNINYNIHYYPDTKLSVLSYNMIIWQNYGDTCLSAQMAFFGNQATDCRKIWLITWKYTGWQLILIIIFVKKKIIYIYIYIYRKRNVFALLNFTTFLY